MDEHTQVPWTTDGQAPWEDVCHIGLVTGHALPYIQPDDELNDVVDDIVTATENKYPGVVQS